MEGILIGLGTAAVMLFIIGLSSIASAINAVANAMVERNKIERKKMELQGLEMKEKKLILLEQILY
jgi:hypothetical protein